MLSKLFGSHARVKILKLFLLHPEERYYIRQIARDLDLQVNSVRRELENLEKFGLLFSRQKGRAGEDETLGQEPEELLDAFSGFNPSKVKQDIKLDKPGKEEKLSTANKQEKKYFQANKKFILFEEVRSLIVKAQVLYEQDFVDKILKVGQIDLLILTGFFVGNQSPADLLIVGEVSKEKLTKIIKELESDLTREINFTLMEPAEFSYRRDMTDVFLYEILESKKIVIVDNVGLG